MYHGKENAAKLGGEGGKGSAQRGYVATPKAQLASARPAAARVLQLRLFALDGAWAEPYMPVRARNKTVKSAAAQAAQGGEGRAP